MPVGNGSVYAGKIVNFPRGITMNPQALITLLEDTDPVVEQELLNFFTVNSGFSDLVQLEVAGSLVSDERKLFFSSLYQLCKLNYFHSSLNQLLASPSLQNPDLLTDALLGMNVFFETSYPVMDCKLILDNLADEIIETIHPDDDLIDKVSAITNVLFFKHQFRGNHNRYYLPENSDLSSVLHHKTGIPVTISMLFFIIARRCGIPVYPAALPRHFMLFMTEPELLFIDCFNNGTFLRVAEVQDFLQQINVQEDLNSFLHPAPSSIIRRMFQNLVYIYSASGSEEKLAVIESLIRKIDDAGK